MRRATFILTILLAAGLSIAAGDPRQAVIAAAIDSAAQGLLEQIETQHITPDLSVGQFLDQTAGRDELRTDLAKSDPVGGPRWLDEHTCQIRLQVSGTEVVADLANIAQHHPDRSPIPPMSIPAVAGQLGSQWFTATGTSTTSTAAPLPPADSPWANIPAEVRGRAVADANSDAVRRVLVSVKSVELTPGHPLAEALSIPTILHSLSDWLSSRPVTAVDYRQTGPNQLEVQVTLSADARDLFDILKTAVVAEGGLATPTDAASWELVRDQIIQHMDAPVGRAAPMTQPAIAAAVQLPLEPPVWTRDMSEATGTGGPSGGRYLLAASAARADAIARLRRNVYALPLTPRQTIAQAAQADAHFAQTIDRAIETGARPYKSVYNPDGTVEMRVSLDLRYLWTAISNHP
jgi:hypothetical protein